MRLANYALSVLSNRRGGVSRPSWCTYLVCFRCNARCGMCDSWRMKPGVEMSPEDVDAVFGKIGRLDVVRLTGGEPFLREDLPLIAAAILRRSRPAVLHVTTNGSFPDRVEAFVRTFPKPKMLRFMVSFDGLEAEHDRSRGKDVSFHLAVETVRRIAALREALGVRVSANHTVINPQSLDDNAGLRARLDEYGVDVHSVLAYSDWSMYGVRLRGRRADHLIVPRGYPLHPDLDGADVLGFTDGQMEVARRYRDPLMRIGKGYYLRGLKSRLEGADDPRPSPRCVALRSHIRLLPDGSVPVCQFNTETVGNLVRQSFDEVWNNDDTKQSRRWVDGCPGCWAECEVMPNALYTGALLADGLGFRRQPNRDRRRAPAAAATGSALTPCRKARRSEPRPSGSETTA